MPDDPTIGEPANHLPLKRRSVVKALGPAAALALAGCLGDDDDDDDDDEETPIGDPDEPQHGGTLDVGMQVGIESLDPRNVTGLQSFQISYNIYSKLLRWTQEDGEFVIEGDLATDWDWEDDTTMVMDLDESAVYHNGDPVLAEDVVYTFQTMFENPGAHTAALMFATDFDVNVIDDHTVEFDTGDRPFGALEESLAFVLGILSEDLDEEYDHATNPVGSGPFEFVEWVDGSHVTVDRFDDYWKEDDDGNQLPYLDGIEFNIFPEDTTKLRELETGGLDWIDVVPWRDVDRVQDEDGIKTISTGLGGWMGIMQFNVLEPPFSDVNVRKAALHAIDFDEIIDTVFYNVAERGNNNPIGPDLGWNFEVDDPYQGQDIDLAQDYLDDADVDHTVTVTNYVTRGYTHRQQMQEIIQRQLEEHLDMNVEIVIEDGSVVFDRQANHEFGFSISAFNGMWDPDQVFSANLMSGAFFNYGGYASEEMDDLLEDARRTFDRDERIDIYEDVAQLYTDEVPKYYPYWDDVNHAMGEHVHGYTPVIDQTWFFESTWMEQ